MEETKDSSLTIIVNVSDIVLRYDSASKAVLPVMVVNVEIRAHNESGVCFSLIHSVTIIRNTVRACWTSRTIHF